MLANPMLQLPLVYELIPKTNYECQEKHIPPKVTNPQPEQSQHISPRQTSHSIDSGSKNTSINNTNIQSNINQSNQVKLSHHPSPTFVTTPQSYNKTSPSTSGQDYFLLKRQSITSLSSLSPMDKPRSKDDVAKPITSVGDIYKNESRSSISESTRLPSLPSIIQSSRSNSYGNILPPVHFQAPAAQVQQVQYQYQQHPYQQQPQQPQQHQLQQQRSHSVPSFSHSQPPPHPVTLASSHGPQIQPPPQQLPQHLHHGPPPVQQMPHPYMAMPMQQQLGPPPHIIPQAAMQMYNPQQGPGGPGGPQGPPQQYMMNTPSGPVYYYPPMYTPEYIYPQYFLGMNYDENQMLINKRRIIKRRTRTGCLTCRKRRIKCDERKPGCFNCERSKKVCLGYENLINKANRRKKDTSLDLKDEDEEEDEEDDKSDLEIEGDKEKISG